MNVQCCVRVRASNFQVLTRKSGGARVFGSIVRFSASPAWIKICNHSQSSLAGVTRKGFTCTLLFPSVLSTSKYFVHACGVRVVFVDHGALASRQFALKSMDVSVRFIHSHFVQSFLVSERIGRSHPRSEAPCI